MASKPLSPWTLHAILPAERSFNLSTRVSSMKDCENATNQHGRSCSSVSTSGSRLEANRLKPTTTRMIRAALLILSAALGFLGRAASEEILAYRVQYDLAAPSIVHISVKFPSPADAPLTLIMPALGSWRLRAAALRPFRDQRQGVYRCRRRRGSASERNRASMVDRQPRRTCKARRIRRLRQTHR